STVACSVAEPRPLKIGIDGRELQGRPTGTGRYLRNLLRAWPAGTGDRLIVYCAGRLPDDPVLSLPGVEPRALGSGTERGIWWAERRLAPAARADAVDAFFSPAYTCPLTLRRPRVTAVHDVSFFAWPDDFSSIDGLRRRLLVRASVGASTAVLACSDFTRHEIARFLPDAATRTVHIPLAPADDLPPTPTRAAARRPRGGGARQARPATHCTPAERLPTPARRPGLRRAAAPLPPSAPAPALEAGGENRTHPPLDVDALIADTDLAQAVRVSGYVS